MIVGFTGTQDGLPAVQAEALEALLVAWRPQPHRDVDEFHHGDCVGADAQAHAIARRLGWRIVGHPPCDPRKRAFCDFDEERAPAPYLVRNAAIVIAVEAMIATPRQAVEQRRSGTWSTIRRARAMNRAIAIVLPNGEYRTEGW